MDYQNDLRSEKVNVEKPQITDAANVTRKVEEQDELTDNLLKQFIPVMRTYFPSKTERAILEHRKKLIAQGSKSKLELIKMYQEFQRQSIKEAMDTMLMEGKSTLRQKNSSMFSKRFNELKKDISALVEEHEKDMREAFTALEKETIAYLRKSKENYLMHVNEVFMNSMKRLLSEYDKIAKEGV